MTTQRLTMTIYDLGCGGGGALMIERAVAHTPGVIAAYVNPATEMAYITFDSERCTSDQVVRAVEDCGFRTGSTQDVLPPIRQHPAPASRDLHQPVVGPGSTRLANRRKLAELTGGIGAGVVGAGLALLLPPAVAAYALPILILGVLMHGWGMFDTHRLEQSTGSVQPRWAELLYWGCWLALLALVIVVVAGVW